MGVGDSKTYHFQSILVREVAMEVWAGGKQILEISCYCKIWGGMGWMVFKTCSRHSWLWVLEEH